MMEEQGMLVQFWWIPQEWNEADAYAKAGAVSALWLNLSHSLSQFIVWCLGQGGCHWRSRRYHDYGADGIIEA